MCDTNATVKPRKFFSHKKLNLKEECKRRNQIISKTDLERSSLSKNIYKDPL